MIREITPRHTYLANDHNNKALILSQIFNLTQSMLGRLQTADSF